MAVSLCFNTFNTSPYIGAEPDVPALIAGVGNAGFTLIGLDVYSLHTYAAAGGSLTDVAAQLKAHHLQCFEVLGLEVGADHNAATAMAKDAGRVVGALGAEYVLTILSTPPDPAVVETMSECADIIGAEGGALALEFMPTSPSATMGAAVDLCVSVGLDRARVLIDTWHFFRGSDDMADLEAFPMTALGYVQFDDARPAVSDDAMLELMNRRALPGNGEFDLEGFSACLLGKGFDGVVSIEVLDEGLRRLPAEDVAKQAMRAAVPYWGLSDHGVAG
jgi:sugar phosphate isomerase/epimerase